MGGWRVCVIAVASDSGIGFGGGCGAGAGGDRGAVGRVGEGRASGMGDAQFGRDLAGADAIDVGSGQAIHEWGWGLRATNS